MYHIYHIPGKKIGVTKNLFKRVTKQQGYKPGEYEILGSSDDIEWISETEKALQIKHGYKKDFNSYESLVKQRKGMEINVTEQTTTFPCPVNKLKGRLNDSLGMRWKTEHGEFNINADSITWIMKNAQTSMFNSERSYVYNKSLSNYFETVKEHFAPLNTIGGLTMPKKELSRYYTLFDL